jgi:hypothetical protein
MKREIVRFKGKLWLVTDSDCWFDGEDDWTTWELAPYGWDGEKERVGPTEMAREVEHVGYEDS